MSSGENSANTPAAPAALLVVLRMFANGHSGPPDLALVHVATSAHVTTLTKARLDGEVEVRSVRLDGPRTRARIGVAALRAAAAAVVASGFPRVAAPVGPPPPATVPPVRLAVVRGEASLSVELPASQVGAVPSFAAAVVAVSGLGAVVRAGAVSATAALRAMSEGGLAAGLAVEVHFVADDVRSFALTLSGDQLVQTERRGARMRTRPLGAATSFERKALALAFFEARFPDAHGQVMPIKGPHYLVRVVFGDASIEVLVDAESIDVHGLRHAIRALYETATRFGVHPLELTADAPPVDMAVTEPPPRVTTP